MSATNDRYADDYALVRLDLLDRAWATTGNGRRLHAVVEGAHALRRHVASGPRALAVRTLPRARLPYPTRYAFMGAALSPVPLLTMFHRTLLVQFLQRGAVKTLLFNPTDVDAAKATPFFAQLVERIPPRVQTMMSPPEAPLLSQLASLGVAATDIDYLAFDHFHTQDLRGLLGTRDRRREPLFPRAKLLAPSIEWSDWEHLHPLQRAWYVADGREGIDPASVILTDGDLQLGDGVYLARTPGHTSGNQTLFVATSSGVWGCSENGTCVDSWSPLDSKIPGIARHARTYGVDLVLNHNTPEASADQYASMSLERVVVDRVPQAPAFAQMFSSSEIVASALAPALRPTITFERIAHGELATRAHAAE